MPVAYQDRPIERLREGVIDQLVMNYGHGEISLEAFERRLDEAYETHDHEVLNSLTADLSLQVDPTYIERKNRELGIHYSSNEPDDVDWMVGVMGGGERTGAWDVPRELRIVTVMGGVKLDFSEARFSQRDLRIRVFCMMGGVDIKVPETVNVRSTAIAIMGGVENRGESDATADGPCIVIEGLVLMGGISIKVKRPVRNARRQFAVDMRQEIGTGAGNLRGS